MPLEVPMDNINALAAATVLDSEGKAIALGSLWRERAVVLIFVRQFG